MEWPLLHTTGADEELRHAHCPHIRLATVPHTPAGQPRRDVVMSWSVCSPSSAQLFSAVAYHFGKILHQELQIPIGLINCSWGGSCAEAWMPLEVLESDPRHRPIVERYRARHHGDISSVFATWTPTPSYHKDAGNFGEARGWALPACDTSAWRELPMPSYWQQHGWNFNGAVWLRHEVTIPQSWRGRELELHLGRLDDFDTTYFNGVRVGETNDDPNAYAIERCYTVPGTLVQPGRATIAVRIFDHFGNGGMAGPVNHMFLTVRGARAKRINLAGTWRAIVERELPMADAASMLSPLGAPAVMYNGMIAPLLPCALRGVIWYQGESNADRAAQYRSLFQSLITSWRACWQQPALPFLFVQLANFKQPPVAPVDDDWAALREAQTAALALPATGMAVAIDSGDANDIHPRNKRDVGKRLALNALARVYGRDVVYSGPLYRSHTIEGSRIRVTFDHVDGGLRARRGALRGFAIAGADQQFVWAQARIEKDTVVVWSDAVPQPVAVRYAWAANPVCNLYNAAGLPAVPFRTDTWPGMTDGKV